MCAAEDSPGHDPTSRQALEHGSAAAPPGRHEIAAWILVGAGLFIILKLHLLSALLAGLLVYELVHIAAPKLPHRLSGERARMLAVTALAILAAGGVAAAATGLIVFVRGEEHLSSLLEKMAESIAHARANLPSSLAAYLPADADAMKDSTVHWLRTHAKDIRTVGADFGRALAHIIVGLVIGAMVSLADLQPHKLERPLARALAERMSRLGNAFRRIVFAQVRISAINALLSGLFLLVGLPIFGVHLPLAKTLVILTFVVGLLPVVGNLISNTVVFIVAFSVSIYVALAALVFLIVIHKLEYFLNARIVGGQISARAWELLVAMLLMEAAFGMSGIIAAPIYYAYLKDELSARELV
jgi:predicted PurR-regulated permease PerM